MPINDKHKNPSYNLRIPKDIMDRLRYIADYNGRSVNREIEQLIKKHLDAFEKQNGEIAINKEEK